MQAFQEFAPQLANCALKKLALTDAERKGITHVIVTCCTGLYAPGLDYETVELLHLNPSVERTFIGFMGCYAAINALKAARHIVRSEPEAKVLLLSLELCSLHMQESQDLEQLLAFTVFADGAPPISLRRALRLRHRQLSRRQSLRHRRTHHLAHRRTRLRHASLWPGSGKLRRAGDAGNRITQGREFSSIDLWAVHPGGRTIIDAVEQGMALPAEAIADSRNILLNYGNMSSASVMFVLQRLMRRARPGQRLRHVVWTRRHRGNHALPCRL